MISAPPPAAESRASEGVPEADVTEVLVTAQGRVQRLQDVPISASITSGATLEQANIRNLEELSARLPAVRIARGPAADVINVRGVGSSLNAGFEQSVATFVDGVYRARARSTRAALFDLERVEVLKGPQTTFFGSNAIAGALNITTRKPGATFAANGTAYWAPAFDDYTLELGVTAPINDKLSVRLSGRETATGGYVRNTRLNEDGPDSTDRIGRASVRWDPTDSVEISGRVDLGSMKGKNTQLWELEHCAPDAPPFRGPLGACLRYLNALGGDVDDALDRNAATNPTSADYKFVESAWSTRIALGDHALILNTGYFEHDFDQLSELMAIPAALNGRAIGSLFNTPNTFPSASGEWYRQVSQEVRITSPAEWRLSYLAGVYVASSKLKTDSANAYFFSQFGAQSGGLYPANARIGVLNANREESDTASVFAAATYKVTSDFRVNLGFRYSEVKKQAARLSMPGSYADSVTTPSVSAFIPGSAAQQAALLPLTGGALGNWADPDRKDAKFMPTASVQYDLNPAAMVYGSYNKGFKAGGFSVGAKSTFGPETVDAFEIGLKSTLFERRLTLNVAAFHNKFKDLQETTTLFLPSGATIGAVANVAASTAKGVEVSGVWRAARGLNLSTDISYLSSKYDAYPNAPCTIVQLIAGGACVQDMSGRPRAYAPRWSGNFNANYQRVFAERWRANLDLTAYFTTKFFQQATADDYLSQDGSTKFDLRLGVGPESGMWEVAVIGRNITNRLTGGFRQQLGGGSLGSIQTMADPPRTVGVQLSFKR
ncbi:TonB-dependent receptor [Phenylobacterium immobile]|uniref:TonB-dependent receptor n=1 Tax=Phenylobacterium immobile TaxID=21 RepID=UPI00159ED0B4|nr:TonB-dependent receptor [Phenylobacterium immobile]